MKFPRTYHLPWSANASRDDKTHENVDFLLSRPIVITEKLDGENQCWSYTDFHLRSESSHGDALRSFSKSYWASVKYLMNPGYFYFVEDISNVHSIEYPDMYNKLFLIAVCNTSTPNTMYWLDWIDAKYEAERLGLPTVPELYRGSLTTRIELSKITTDLAVLSPTKLGGKLEWYELIVPKVPANQMMEGVVVRPFDSFTDWSANTAKYVRKDHVKSTQHWVKEQYAKLRQREKAK